MYARGTLREQGSQNKCKHMADAEKGEGRKTEIRKEPSTF